MRILLITLFLLTFSFAVFGQTNPVYVTAAQPDTVKLSVSFANSDYTLDHLQGIQAELDARIGRYEKVRIGGALQYVRTCFGCGVEVDSFSFGPNVSYDVLGDKVSVFGRALFGVTTDYTGTNAFTRTYGFGADVNLGHIFVRPFTLDYLRIEGVPITVERYGAGVGVRF